MQASRDLTWKRGIVVKVVDRNVGGGKFYKQKGVVEEVVQRYTAHVRMNEGGALLKLDQDLLQTVIPSVGGRVKIVNGRGRGASATLLKLDVDNFCVSLQVDAGQGAHAGKQFEGVEYEDVCKLAA